MERHTYAWLSALNTGNRLFNKMQTWIRVYPACSPATAGLNPKEHKARSRTLRLQLQMIAPTGRVIIFMIRGVGRHEKLMSVQPFRAAGLHAGGVKEFSPR